MTDPVPAPPDDTGAGEPEAKAPKGWLLRTAEGVAWFGEFSGTVRSTWGLLKLAGQAVVAVFLFLFGR